MAELKENKQRVIEVTEKDLPLHCPTPDQVKWNSHPRVFLPVHKTGEALCPYCGTLYKLVGPVSGHHH
ncbi:zinc-finger domain-containing protein [Crenobacter sp. SG2303]|uniref:Zinc-finger domain-containing protein n=1 Tax=Crenobacter oryzisoli TaxID=3056844 RepID=A0ABT7XS00_9NEIS|nr:zinc-finger domain-containing protein [Crenobacter sp. SG2303]MDN0076574.1 zinc-finger domain-containing protein [Crenobacter sp. SG2303]